MEPIQVVLTIVGVLAYFASGVMLGIVADAMAKSKGYKGHVHLITCVVFNIFGFIGACALPDKKTNEKILKELKALSAVFGAEVPEEEELPSHEEEYSYEPAPEPRSVRRPAGNVQPPVSPRAPQQAAPQARREQPSEPMYRPEPSPSSYFPSRSMPTQTSSFVQPDENATAQVEYKDGAVLCSRCKGEIKLNATVCPHCRAKIGSSPSAGGLGYIKPLK